MFATHSGRPGMVIVHVGMLDDSSWFSPQVVLYTRSKPAWDVTTDSVPNFESAPSMPVTPQR
jgi:hypothetical protein